MKCYTVKELREILLQTELFDQCEYSDEFLDYLEKKECEQKQ